MARLAPEPFAGTTSFARRGDDRQIAIVLRPLAAGLDRVVVTEETGTLRWRFPLGPCKESLAPPLVHRTYCVLWFKLKPARPPLLH